MTETNQDAHKSAKQMTAVEKAAYIGTHGLEAWTKKVQRDYAPQPKPAGAKPK